MCRYRTITGRCNNLARPLQGAALTGLARLLPAQYSDDSRGFRARSHTSIREPVKKKCEKFHT